MRIFDFDLWHHKNMASAATVEAANSAAVLEIHPVTREIKKGYQIIKPADGYVPEKHIIYFHGIGGISQEDAFLQDLAAGKFAAPVGVIVPLAKEIVPKRAAAKNAWQLYDLWKFANAYPEIREQLVCTMAGEESGFIQAARSLLSAIHRSPSWYDFSFEKRPVEAHVRGKKKKSILRPHYDRTIDAIFENGAVIAPMVWDFIKQEGIETPIDILSFSQGAGIGLAMLDYSEKNHPGKVGKIVMVSGSYYETETSRQLRSAAHAFVVLPKDDPVTGILNFYPEKVRRDLVQAFSGQSDVVICDGDHHLVGDAARTAAKLLAMPIGVKNAAVPVPVKQRGRRPHLPAWMSSQNLWPVRHASPAG